MPISSQPLFTPDAPASGGSGSAPPDAPRFDAAAPHHQRPQLRPVQAFQARNGENVMLGLSDPRQITDRVVFTSPLAQFLLPNMDGSKDLETIVAGAKEIAVQQKVPAPVIAHLTRQNLEFLVAQLDQAGLLEGPSFQSMLNEMKREFDSKPVLPPATSHAMAEAMSAEAIKKAGEEAGSEIDEAAKTLIMKQRVGEMFDTWMTQALSPAPDPSFDRLPRAVFVPHIDYGRGWLNYAHTYGRLRVVDRPDRIIILGTNHFGFATGVCGCDKGYETPLGVCELDGRFVDALRSRLGPEAADRLFAQRFDHEREHSIELQIMWIQHVFGPDERGAYPKVFGALVHDPSRNNYDSYDGTGLGLHPFVEAVRATIEQMPGRTLIVSSADLSHVGPQFGDPTPVAGETEGVEEFRTSVIRKDQELLASIAAGKPDELVAAMAWQGNPTRWCSTGNIAATMMITGAESVRILSYAAAADSQGNAMVSHFAGVVA